MGTFLAYTIKVAICLLFLFVFTKLVFGRDTLHKFNRAVWLLIVPASLLLPLLDIGLWPYFESDHFVSAELLPEELSAISAEEIAPAQAEKPLLPLVRSAAAVYFAGVLGIALYFIIFYIRLFLLILPKGNDLCRYRNALHGSASQYLELLRLCKEQVGYSTKVHFIVHQKDIAPFSWMRYVVISESDLVEDGRAILIHELSHVKGGHSWDILLMDLMILFQWFNPAAWLSKRSLQQVHEYCADESVIESGVDAKTYQLLSLVSGEISPNKV